MDLPVGRRKTAVGVLVNVCASPSTNAVRVTLLYGICDNAIDWYRDEVCPINVITVMAVASVDDGRSRHDTSLESGDLRVNNVADHGMECNAAAVSNVLKVRVLHAADVGRHRGLISVNKIIDYPSSAIVISAGLVIADEMTIRV